MKSIKLLLVLLMLLANAQLLAQLNVLRPFTKKIMVFEDYVRHRQGTAEELRDLIYEIDSLDSNRTYWTPQYTVYLAELNFIDNHKDKGFELLEYAIRYFGLESAYLERQFNNYPEVLSFLHLNYIRLYQSYEDGLDKKLLALFNDMSIIDQTWRKQEDSVRKKYSDEYGILASTDSLITETYLSLFRKGIYFNQKNIGKQVWSKFAYYLHLSDTREEDKWNELLSHFKKEVIDGSLRPEHLAMIMDRHYLFSLGQKCRPMGSGYFGGAYPICDMKIVDQLRWEIGLPPLGFFYKLNDKELPQGYEWKEE